MKPLVGVLIGLVVLGIAADAIFFFVDEREQVVVTRLGNPIHTIQSPGLQIRAPFIEQVHRFDDRLLASDADPAPIYTLDKKNLIVDNFARWRIVDPLKFMRSVQTVFGAQSRLDDIIYAAVREELGQHTLEDIVSGDRDAIMHSVTGKCREDAADLGIEVVDVRIKRADLPEENKKNVFGPSVLARPRSIAQKVKRLRSKFGQRPISRSPEFAPRPHCRHSGFAARVMPRL